MAAETLVGSYSASYGIPAVSLRYFNVAGADPHGWFIGFAYNEKGEAVSGEFIRADSKTVRMEVDGEEVAVPLDDERDTFHPLIWDETEEADPTRIQQALCSQRSQRAGYRQR